MNIKLSMALAAMFVATSALADADHGYPESAIRMQTAADDMVQAQQPASEKTRDQVRQELIEAERAGLVPAPKSDYPPSQTAIARNKARFRITERYLATKQLPMQNLRGN